MLRLIKLIPLPQAFFALGLNLRKFFLIRSAGTRMPRSFYLQIMTLVNILLFIPFTYVFLQKILADVDLIVDEKPWVERENSARLTRYALFFPKQFLILAFTSETYDYRDVERCLHTSFCEPYLLTIIMDLISLWLILFSDCTVVYYGLERLRCLMNSFARLGRPYFRGALIFTCAFGFLIAVGALLSRYWLYLHLEKRNLVVFEDMVQMAREYHASLEKKSSYQVLENKHADLKVGSREFSSFFLPSFSVRSHFPTPHPIQRALHNPRLNILHLHGVEPLRLPPRLDPSSFSHHLSQRAPTLFRSVERLPRSHDFGPLPARTRPATRVPRNRLPALEQTRFPQPLGV